jgi:VIT1/CCC1 family predicted Fe2+/Mn2+ transporter
MTAVAIGPFLIPGDRLTFLIGGAFLIGAGALLARLVDRRIGDWSISLLLIVIVAGRLGYVASFPESF